jgi:hypothetical protein
VEATFCFSVSAFFGIPNPPGWGAGHSNVTRPGYSNPVSFMSPSRFPGYWPWSVTGVLFTRYLVHVQVLVHVHVHVHVHTHMYMYMQRYQSRATIVQKSCNNQHNSIKPIGYTLQNSRGVFSLRVLKCRRQRNTYTPCWETLKPTKGYTQLRKRRKYQRIHFRNMKHMEKWCTTPRTSGMKIPGYSQFLVSRLATCFEFPVTILIPLSLI